MPRSLWRHLLILSALLVFFTATSPAQTSALQGTVKDENGKPVAGALIRLERTDIKGRYQVKTKRKGDWFHAGLPLGTYNVSLEIGGKVVDFVNGVRTRFGEVETVNFDLAEVKNRQAAAAAGVQLTAEQARQMTPEQRRQIEEANKKRQEQLSKNKALNDAFNVGREAMTAKNWDLAIESFTKAAELDPKQHVVWAHLADTQMQVANTKSGAEQQTAITKAMESYVKALELKPDDAAYHNNYGLALVRVGKFDEAQAELGKAAQLDPANAGRYYYNLGAVLVNTGKGEEAYEAFKKSIEADPNYADAHYQIGVYLLSKAQVSPEGKVTPAAGTLEAFQKYLELRPTGPYADSAKGSIQALQTSVETQFSTKPAKKSRK